MVIDSQYIDVINSCYDPRWDTFKWKIAPKKPNSILMDYDEGETLTKEEFWTNNDLEKEDTPVYGQKDNNGIWRFQWEAGDIGGFIEGEDFDF